MTTEQTESQVTPEVPFDEAAPEPDTLTGGRFIFAVLVLIVGLVIAWGLLAGLYKSSVTQVRSTGEDFRLRQVIAANDTWLEDYRSWSPEDDEATYYQVPVGAAVGILLESPDQLAGDESARSVPASETTLPEAPTRQVVLGGGDSEGQSEEDAAADDEGSDDEAAANEEAADDTSEQ